MSDKGIKSRQVAGHIQYGSLFATLRGYAGAEPYYNVQFPPTWLAWHLPGHLSCRKTRANKRNEWKGT